MFDNVTYYLPLRLYQIFYSYSIRAEQCTRIRLNTTAKSGPHMNSHSFALQ